MGYPPLNKNNKTSIHFGWNTLTIPMLYETKSPAILAIGTKHRQEAKYHRNNINYRVD